MAELAPSFVPPQNYMKFPKGLITFLFFLFEGYVISKSFGTERLCVLEILLMYINKLNSPFKIFVYR